MVQLNYAIGVDCLVTNYQVLKQDRQQKKWSKVIKLRLISQWNFRQYFRRINKIKLNNKINEIMIMCADDA